MGQYGFEGLVGSHQSDAVLHNAHSRVVFSCYLRRDGLAACRVSARIRVRRLSRNLVVAFVDTYWAGRDLVPQALALRTN